MADFLGCRNRDHTCFGVAFRFIFFPWRRRVRCLLSPPMVMAESMAGATVFRMALAEPPILFSPVLFLFIFFFRRVFLVVVLCCVIVCLSSKCVLLSEYVCVDFICRAVVSNYI